MESQSQLWDTFLNTSLHYLHENHLTRTLRPLDNVNSAVRVSLRWTPHVPAPSLTLPHGQATVSAADLERWVQGLPPTPLHSAAPAIVRCPELQQHRSGAPARASTHCTEPARSITLFSSNDYLGLSSHPDVLEAAARTTSQVSSMGGAPQSFTTPASILVHAREHALHAERTDTPTHARCRAWCMQPQLAAADAAAVAAACSCRWAQRRGSHATTQH
jgi:hypothetical protein